MAIQDYFIWGDGGQQLTPEQVAERRKRAEAMMMEGADYSPVQHWTQGLSRVASALVGGLNAKRADEAEAAGMERARQAIYGNPELSGLIQPVPQASSTTPSASTGGNADAIRQGLIDRGMAPHVADGFVMNFQDESGLDPTINEVSPTVPGSRGGFGIAQWTGPRRAALEDFAKGRGTSAGDLNTQLDYLMTELSGPEAGAAKAIYAAPDSGTAAQEIVNRFLRPAEEHRVSRAQRYGGAGSEAVSAGPSPAIAALAGAMGDPWVRKAYGPVVQELLGQQIQRENAQYDQRIRQSDPMYQAQLAQMQAEAQRRAENPDYGLPADAQGLAWRAREAGLKPGSDEYKQFILNGGRSGTNAGPAAFQALDMQAQAAGFVPGTPEYQQFMATKGAGLAAGAQADARAASEGRVAAEGGLPLARQAVQSIDDLINDPALHGITGGIQGRVPQMAMGEDSRRAASRLEQIKGQSFLQMRQYLKGQGAITDYESARAEAAMARLDRAQSDEDFRAALQELRSIMQTGYDRLQQKIGGGGLQNPPQVKRYNPATGAFE